MTVNKNAGDYRLIEEFDEKGRVTTTTEYIGPAYYYRLDKTARRHELHIVVAATALACILWIVALIPYSDAARHYYVSLPFVCAAIPLFLLATTVFMILRTPEPLERRHVHRIRNHYPAASAIAGLLAAISALGALISAILSGTWSSGDIVFIACALAMVGLLALCYAKCDAFAVHE